MKKDKILENLRKLNTQLVDLFFKFNTDDEMKYRKALIPMQKLLKDCIEDIQYFEGD
jgi:hypothetical protein